VFHDVIVRKDLRSRAATEILTKFGFVLPNQIALQPEREIVALIRVASRLRK
jgi:hypothetical protein